MQNFYFTYGSEGHPFVGGWTVVKADDMAKAVAAFRAFHPDIKGGLLACAGVYTEEQFLSTGMAKKGNYGHTVHETICVERSADHD